MIKINVYDYPESAREVFKAFYEMIVDDIPFPTRAVTDAFNNAYLKQYGIELGLPNSRKDTFNIKVTENYKHLLKEYEMDIYGIDSWTDDQLIKIHYELAERIINNTSVVLHDFIYKNKLGDEIEIDTKDLGILLCGFMDYRGDEEKSTDESYHIYLLRKEYSKIRSIANGDLSKEKRFRIIQKQLQTYVFCYEKVASKQKTVYSFVDSLGVTVCPYCNRNYTQVIKVKPKKKEGFHTRPDLDHFWSKSLYPFLALSMRNLVPSCKVCNLAKHDTDRFILYPYKEGINDAYRFSMQIKKDVSLLTRDKVDPNDYQLKFVKDETCISDKDSEKRMSNSIETFGWEEIYKTNSDYALKLFQNSYIFNKDHINSYFTSMKSVFSSYEECRQILNPMWVPKERFLEQPLSKLTYDISRQAEEDNTDLLNDDIIKRIIGKVYHINKE